MEKIKKIEKLKLFIRSNLILEINSNRTYTYLYIFIHKFIILLISIFISYIFIKVSYNLFMKKYI